jgi:hypothetical protein
LICINNYDVLKKYQKIGINWVCSISRPELLFGLIYFDLAVSYFYNRPIEFTWVIGFGFLLVINKPVRTLTLFISKQLSYFYLPKIEFQALGKIIGYDTYDLLTIETEGSNYSLLDKYAGSLIGIIENQTCFIGLVINEKSLLSKKWLTVKAIHNPNNEIVSFNITTYEAVESKNTIFTVDNQVCLIDYEHLPVKVKEQVAENPIYRNISNMIGYIWSGSSINKIRFYSLIKDNLLTEKNLGEGSIIQTRIAQENVLFQIIDARTESEGLESYDSHGFLLASAQKLGKYDLESKELNTVKWVPEIYSPVYMLDPVQVGYNPQIFVGRLPGTNYGIPIKNIDELITHNTAILGILGIGKSCLTFELLQKIINNTQVKIICIDITNQYARALSSYLSEDFIQDELPQNIKDDLRANNRIGIASNPATWGNEALYKTKLDVELNNFANSDKRILVLNPDWHPVSKAASSFNIQSKVDLTVAEKTRIISERVFKKAKNEGETPSARYLIVFEEAHSLVPEWNSVANEGDKVATNGTAKVILQGRKYGLGSFVITQRTANISKSILNQCNTIFALRVFDDTGKQFLENYIGSDYSNLLPMLEERHAIAIGKALKLKQPVMIKLNNRDEIAILENEESDVSSSAYEAMLN